MADLRGFDANTVEPNDSFDPLPNGDYLCVISSSEMKPTKSGDGSFLELEMEVIDGPCKGRKVWDRLNLNNANETAVRIAQGTLSAICRAVNVLTPTDSCELHDIPLVVKVVCKKRADTGEMTNEVKGYKGRNAVAKEATSAVGSPQVGAQAQASAAGSAPPWKRT